MIRIRRMNRSSMCAVFLALPLLIGAAQRSGISPNEHWALHAVIPVWVDRQNMPPEGDRLVERAMRTWTTAADGGFTLQRSFAASENAGIRVYFNGAGGNYGETRP